MLLGLQIFELWERPGAAGDEPRHYVKCIYNNKELSLAHHPNGVLSSSTMPLMSFGTSNKACSCHELEDLGH